LLDKTRGYRTPHIPAVPLFLRYCRLWVRRQHPSGYSIIRIDSAKP